MALFANTCHEQCGPRLSLQSAQAPEWSLAGGRRPGTGEMQRCTRTRICSRASMKVREDTIVLLKHYAKRTHKHSKQTWNWDTKIITNGRLAGFKNVEAFSVIIQLQTSWRFVSSSNLQLQPAVPGLWIHQLSQTRWGETFLIRNRSLKNNTPALLESIHCAWDGQKLKNNFYWAEN